MRYLCGQGRDVRVEKEGAGGGRVSFKTLWAEASKVVDVGFESDSIDTIVAVSKDDATAGGIVGAASSGVVVVGD